MRTYRSSSLNWVGSALFVFVLMLAAGILLLVSGMPFEGVPAVLVCMGAPLTVLLAAVFFGVASRNLTLDDEKIVFPRATRINGKNHFKRRAVPFEEICSFSSKFAEGDHGWAVLISFVLTGNAQRDTIFYSVKTKDGTSIDFTLFDYGKETEKEIAETIRRKMNS